jgi:caa(3)-type oxidase subunit IV
MYLIIGAVLLVFTGITVALSYVEMGITNNWIVGMAVATFKVCLVGAVFMHLKGEVKTIWRPIWFTLMFCTFLFLLFAWAWSDPLGGHDHAEKEKVRTGTIHTKH